MEPAEDLITEMMEAYGGSTPTDSTPTPGRV